MAKAHSFREKLLLEDFGSFLGVVESYKTRGDCEKENTQPNARISRLHKREEKARISRRYERDNSARELRQREEEDKIKIF